MKVTADVFNQQQPWQLHNSGIAREEQLSFPCTMLETQVGPPFFFEVEISSGNVQYIFMRLKSKTTKDQVGGILKCASLGEYRALQEEEREGGSGVSRKCWWIIAFSYSPASCLYARSILFDILHPLLGCWKYWWIISPSHAQAPF